MKYSKTRYDFLGYAKCGNTWRFVDLTDTPAVVGEHYRTKAELLAHLDRYAAEFSGILGISEVYNKNLAEVALRMGIIVSNITTTSARLTKLENAEFVSDIEHHLAAIEYAIETYGKIAKR